jgi:hypothetical protein
LKNPEEKAIQVDELAQQLPKETWAWFNLHHKKRRNWLTN